jgi:hypothetical protein
MPHAWTTTGFLSIGAYPVGRDASR